MFRKELQVCVMDRGGCVVTLMRQVWVGVDQRGNSSSAGQVPSDIGWITRLTPTYQPAYSASKQYLHTESLTYFICATCPESPSRYRTAMLSIQQYAVAYFRRIDPASLRGLGYCKYKSPSAVCHRFNPRFLHNTHHVFYFSIHQFVACSCNICRWRT